MGDLFAEYMTPAEFAALPSDAHHAVWAAHAEGRVDAARLSQVLVYNRAQVAGLLRAMAVADA